MAFAGNLKVYNPKQRPSLLEWRGYLAPSPISDVCNVWNTDERKVSQPRLQDLMEVEGDNMKPPECEEAETR